MEKRPGRKKERMTYQQMQLEWKTFLYYYIGSVYIPPELIHSQERKILHITDTPGIFVTPLKRLLRKLNPHVIIHTGDMVDDIKLEFVPGARYRYESALKNLMKVLQTSKADRIYIVPGNHDDIEIISRLSYRCDIMENGGGMVQDDIPFAMTHKGEQADGMGRYILYGHNSVPPSRREKGHTYLNGIEGIHVILLPSEKVITLPYPMGTNEARLNQGRFSL